MDNLYDKEVFLEEQTATGEIIDHRTNLVRKLRHHPYDSFEIKERRGSVFDRLGEKTTDRKSSTKQVKKVIITGKIDNEKRITDVNGNI